MLNGLKTRLAEGKPLFTSDELAHYATMLFELYHHEVAQPTTGAPGRPRKPVKIVDNDLDYATVHKTREKGHVVQVDKKVIYGDADRIAARLVGSPSHTINTSFIERFNGLLRQMDAHLRRKGQTFARALRYLKAKLAFAIAWYNFARPHGTLSRNPDRTTSPRTPAMLAGLAAHPWSIPELLSLAPTLGCNK